MEYRAENPFDGESSQSSQSGLSPKAQELMRREEEISRRERALESRAQMLNERAKNAPVSRKAPNWPIFRPFIHQDISEMPTPALVKLVRLAYIGWILGSVALVYNWVALLANLIGADQGGKSIGDMVLAIVYFFILCPTWFLIFRVLYRAARKQKPSLFVVFFCLYFLQLVAYAGIAVGFTGTGSAGYWRMIIAFKDKHRVVGIMLLASGILWSVCFALGLFIMILARVQFSAAGGIAQSKREMASTAATTAANNPDVMFKGAQMASSTV